MSSVEKNSALKQPQQRRNRKRKLNDGSGLFVGSNADDTDEKNPETQQTTTTFFEMLNSQDIDTLLAKVTSLEDIDSTQSKLKSMIRELERRSIMHPSLSNNEKLTKSIKLIDSNYDENGDVAANMCGADWSATFVIGPNRTQISLFGNVEDYEGDLQGSVGLYHQPSEKELWYMDDLQDSGSFYLDLSEIKVIMIGCGLYDDNELFSDQSNEIRTFCKKLTSLCFEKAKSIDKFKVSNGMFVDSDDVIGWIDSYQGNSDS